jgi:enoyl-CoA hydratase/carnithine racemase
VRSDDDIRVAVLRANGRGFCSGIDVGEIGARTPSSDPWAGGDPGILLCPKQASVWKPVVTAVHGVVAGGAFYFVNESDLIVASPDAVFFDPHVSRGLVTSLTAIGMLHHGVALREALRIALLSGDERVSAETALRIGLVNEIVERDHLWDRARTLALQIAAKPPAALQGSIRAIWTSLDLPWAEARRHGLMHSQIGNPVAATQLDPDAPRGWTLR